MTGCSQDYDENDINSKWHVYCSSGRYLECCDPETLFSFTGSHNIPPRALTTRLGHLPIGLSFLHLKNTHMKKDLLQNDYKIGGKLHGFNALWWLQLWLYDSRIRRYSIGIHDLLSSQHLTTSLRLLPDCSASGWSWIIYVAIFDVGRFIEYVHDCSRNFWHPAWSDVKLKLY